MTATDLPDILPNLTFNLLRNTKGRCRYTPQVAPLTWGQHLERDFPHLSCHYDYVLAADVVYHHDSLEELLETMRHFCRPGSRTTLLWANKIRFHSDLRFRERFESSFNTTLLTELPQQEVRIYQATAKEWQEPEEPEEGEFSKKLEIRCLKKGIPIKEKVLLTFLDSVSVCCHTETKWTSWLKLSF